MNEQMTLTLTGGVVMPMAGIGTFLLSPDEVETSCVSALAGGCRLIDTANAYVNEQADAVEKTLERLDTGCIDLGKLKALFHIDRLMLAGGGQMNWSFAQEDLIDELSIILAPPQRTGTGKRRPCLRNRRSSRNGFLRYFI
ncbi:MAG: hypothetical protein HFF65_09955 [Oscillospiraceae bacterium]|jgi:riboflavin biosynthesis pyrimidine reductase|nr:dihydrofolate reductase family protein [uncultured Oscillibacter sp.]MCI9392697.1 hypothetical protein [Oscillospiraceae bacterium]